MSDSSYWSLFKSITSVISRKKEPVQQAGGAVKAHLGEESSFYYDAEKKRWVNKNVSCNHAVCDIPVAHPACKASAETEKELAPPPPPPSSTPFVLSRASTPAQTTSIPSSISAGTPPLPPGSQSVGGRGGARRGARNRYVDIMNPNQSSASSADGGSRAGSPQVPMPSIPSANKGSQSLTNSPTIATGPRPKIMRPLGSIQRTNSTPNPHMYASPLNQATAEDQPSEEQPGLSDAA
jgi:hypothetical protein